MAVGVANKSNTINAMLLRAWRERWDDAQWGTHIKTVCVCVMHTRFLINSLIKIAKMKTLQKVG